METNFFTTKFVRLFFILMSGVLFCTQTAFAAVSYSQSVTLAPGWNIVSTPRILESHSFSAPETLENFSIYILDASRPSGWATMAELGQTEFTPLYGYFVYNNTGVGQTLTFNYEADTTPNQRLFERDFIAEGWYSFGVANPSYAKAQGDSISDTDNPDHMLNSLLGLVSDYDAVVDFTTDFFPSNPDSVSAEGNWVYALRSPDVTNSSEINLLNDFRETKGYAIHIKYPTTTLSGFQNNNIPACLDGVDNDNDTFVDFPADNGCVLSTDNTEDPVFATGSLSVVKAVDSPSGSISFGATGTTLAQYVLTAAHERIKVESIRVLMSSNDAGVGSLRSGALFANGVQIGSTQNLSSSTVFNLGSSLIIDPTVPPVTLEVRTDVFDADGNNDLSAGDTISLAIEIPNALNLTSLSYVSVNTVDANVLSVTAATLNLSKYTAYANQTVTVPQAAFKIGEYRIAAGTEGVNLDTITATLTSSGILATSTDITNLYVVYGTKTSQIKSAGSATQSWSINESLPANTSMNVTVYATLGSAIGSGATLSPSLLVSGTSQNSGSAVTSATVAGQVLTVSTGALTGVVDASTPVAANVVGNSMPKVGSFKFSAANDAFTITQIAASTTDSSSIIELVFKDGATELGRQAFNGNTATKTGLSIPVAANTSKVVDVYANLGSVGTNAGATGGNVGVSLIQMKYLNSNGVETSTTSPSGSGVANTQLVGNAMYVFKTKPTITNVALPTTQLTPATLTVYKFTVTADAGGTVAWRKISLNWSTSTPAGGAFTVSGWAIYDAANESTALANVSATSTISGGATGRTDFISTVDQEVSGSKTYVVKALVSGTVLTGASVSHSIAAGASAHTNPVIYTSVTAPSTFIWSDESIAPHGATSADWNNDYLVKNLPTDSLTLTK